jgi:RNA polymerase sigma-70 factor (ECF subfamily)
MSDSSKRPYDPDRESTATSRSLLERVKADDGEAWDRLVSLYAPLVFRWCQGGRLNPDEASDVFQEVFQAVAMHIGDFRKQRNSDTFRGWLRTITRNKIYDHLRRKGREPQGVGGTISQSRFAQLPDQQSSPEVSEFAISEERALFYRALELIRSEFSDRTWQAFWRTAVDDQLARDVALELSMTPGAVRVAKSRVLRRLRDELGDLPQ